MADMNPASLVPDSGQQMGQIQGIQSLKDIDLIKASSIEGAATKFTFNVSALPVRDLKDQLVDILSSMQQFMEKYFQKPEGKEYSHEVDNYLIKVDGHEYNFYQLKEELRFVNNRDGVRIIANAAFGIYNHFAKQIGIEIATTRVNPKKK